jgi:hypothetical protein
MRGVPLRVFISYEFAAASLLAEMVFEAYQEVGVSGWVWHLHRESGGYLRTEIAERIGEADFVLFICTAGTIVSDGQTFEINNATNRNKHIWVATLGGEAFVPPALLGYIYDSATEETIGKKCQEIVNRLGQPTWPEVNSQQVVTSEASDVVT